MGKKKQDAYAQWWKEVREFLTVLGKNERTAVVEVIGEIDAKLAKIAKGSKK